jgi:uncharacterized membrane protein YgcG
LHSITLLLLSIITCLAFATKCSLRTFRSFPSYQAGSDSLLTSAVYFALREKYFDGEIDEKLYAGRLYGYGGGSGGGGGGSSGGGGE